MNDDGNEYEVKEFKSYGIFVSLVKKNGGGQTRLLNSAMTDNEFEKYKQLFFAEDVDQGKSYLVSYDNELLTWLITCLLGTPTENFHLPFGEYGKK